MKSTRFLCITAVLTAAVLAGCSGNTSKISRPLLGTIVTITISGEPDKTAEAFNAAFNEIEKIQAAFNPGSPDSEIYTINRTAPYRPVKVSDDVFYLIDRSLEISRITRGAFDITFASAGKLWDFSGETFTPPDDRTIKKLLPLISYKSVILDRRLMTVRFLKPDTKIGLGGIAKGFAVKKAVAELRKKDIKGAIVACAGDIQVIGDNNGVPWRTGIRDPRGESVIGAIDMHDGEAVSTSGDYERFRIVNGKRYHHIINPATGYPSDSGLISVTVFSRDPVMSDAFSTAFFISGLEKSRKMLLTDTGLSAVLVTEDMTVYVSESLKNRISFRNGLKVIYF